MSFSKVFYVDPCSDILSFDGKNFHQAPVYSSSDFISSRVFYDDIVAHSFKIPKDTSLDEVASTIELKMYEEVGLDLQKEYKIAYTIKELEFDAMLLVEAFAVEKSSLQSRFKDALKKYKHIDFFAIPFLSFSTLYTNKIIAPKNDIFVYIEKNEGFLALYKDGKYLSTKSLFTLSDIVAHLHKNDIEIDIEKLESLLKEKGLDPNAYTKGDAEIFASLETIFAEIFTKINNVIIHSRSVFGFEKVDRLFFGTNFGRIKGLKEISLNFFSSDLKLMDFNLFSEKVESGFFERIIASYAYDMSQSMPKELDITFFPRTKPFLKQEAGKFLLFSILVFVFTSLYPLYLSFDISKLSKEQSDLEKSVTLIRKNTKQLRDEIKTTRDTLAGTQEEIKVQEQRIDNISKSIEELYNIKTSQKGSSQFFISVNNLLKKYNLATRSIVLKDANHMNIEVYSSLQRRDTIAKFMKDLIQMGYVEVTTKEISLSKDTYISIVEVAR